MHKQRLDQALVARGLVTSRSQAESYIKLGYVKVNGLVTKKPGDLVRTHDTLEITAKQQYVSRAALKLASVAKALGLQFRDKIVLDVGSSTGGFTDYALRHGANQVIAVDVGTGQMHPNLRSNPRVMLFEQTDIRDIQQLPMQPDIVLVDVSFISLKEILPYVSKLMARNSQLVAMLKPQFEAGEGTKHKGVIKNEKLRREVLKGFESWVQSLFILLDKADSQVTGEKGNRERFYLLKKI